MSTMVNLAIYAVLGAVLCAAVTGFLLPKGTSPAQRRLAGLLRGSVERGVRRGASCRNIGLLGQRGAAALAGMASALLLGGARGLMVGAVVAVVCAWSLSRMEPKGRRRRRTRLLTDLPIAVELLAACLRGGVSWGEAVEAVADAIGGPLGDELHTVAAQVRLGADPVDAWLTLADDPALAPLARTAARAARSGTALAPTLTRLARDQRRSAHAAACARARAAGVRAVAPLGLCFLPAFVLLGIIPAIAGIASTILLPW